MVNGGAPGSSRTAQSERLRVCSLAMGLSGGSGPCASGLLTVLFPKSTNQHIIGRRAQHICGIAQKYDCIAQMLRSLCCMATHRDKDERRILRCAACDGTVLAEIAGFGRADANTACASCGMTLLDSPFSGGDYFDVIMRVGRPRARLRRAG